MIERIESFTYRKWFKIEPARTSKGIMEMTDGFDYEVEMMSTRSNGDRVYKIRGNFNGSDDFWGGNDSIIVSQRIYDLIKAYSRKIDFVTIK